MDHYEAIGRVENGKLRLGNRPLFDEAMKSLDGRDVIVEVRRAYANRSGQQNKWYWSCLVAAISEYTGFTPEETHAVLKARFLPKALAVADRNGVVVGEYVIGGTTTSLTTKEMAEYCERVRQFAAEELAIDIPDPVAAC
jgi:hypothetical protein